MNPPECPHCEGTRLVIVALIPLPTTGFRFKKKSESWGFRGPQVRIKDEILVVRDGLITSPHERELRCLDCEATWDLDYVYSTEEL